AAGNSSRRGWRQIPAGCRVAILAGWARFCSASIDNAGAQPRPARAMTRRWSRKVEQQKLRVLPVGNFQREWPGYFGAVTRLHGLTVKLQLPAGNVQISVAAVSYVVLDAFISVQQGGKHL